MAASQVAQGVKNLPTNPGEKGLISGLGTLLGGGNGNPLQNSCLENPMDRGVWKLQSMGSQKVGHTGGLSSCGSWALEHRLQ